MSHILRTSTEHKTASLADEGNSAYCQSSGAVMLKLCRIFSRYLSHIYLENNRNKVNTTWNIIQDGITFPLMRSLKMRKNRRTKLSGSCSR